MILVRSPLRISLGGGGTDLPSYYSGHEGYLISAAIDKYVYINIMKPFSPGIYLKYSDIEKVSNVNDIKHPIIKEVLQLDPDFNSSQIEISSLADIPAGTGLGSSGSFTTALIRALYAYSHRSISPNNLAELACHVEIDRLGEPIGKQDQYISAHGGVTQFQFKQDGTVNSMPLRITEQTRFDLEDNLLLFFTGYSRSASNILLDQDKKSKNDDHEMIENLHQVKKMGYQIKTALEGGDLHEFAHIMHQHWVNKKKRSSGISNGKIDAWYDIAMNNGAIGGKVVGAGGGGFLMFYAEDIFKLRNAMQEVGLQEVRFRFDYDGTKVLIN
jgi:D-glycero-alpha-D-manno-heptose-7-phosphate kinase